MFWFSVNLSFSCLYAFAALPRVRSLGLMFFLAVFDNSGTGMLGGMYFTLDFPTSMAVIWLGTALGVCVSGAFPRFFATPNHPDARPLPLARLPPTQT